MLEKNLFAGLLVAAARALAEDRMLSGSDDGTNDTVDDPVLGDVTHHDVGAGIIFVSIFVCLVCFFFKGDDMVEWFRKKLEQYEITASVMSSSLSFGFCQGIFPIWIPGVATIICGAMAKCLGFSLGPAVLGKKIAIPFWATFLLPYVRAAEFVFGLEAMEIAQLREAWNLHWTDAMSLFGKRLLLACAMWAITIPIIYLVLYYMCLPMCYVITGELETSDGLDDLYWEPDEEPQEGDQRRPARLAPTSMLSLESIQSATAIVVAKISPRAGSALSPRGGASGVSIIAPHSSMTKHTSETQVASCISEFTDFTHSLPPWMARPGASKPLDEFSDVHEDGDNSNNKVSKERTLSVDSVFV